MRRLELDFLRDSAATPWVGWVLLAAALAFALDLGRGYIDTRAALAQKEARLAMGVRAASAPAPARGELEAARETIRRLATPWSELFAALESAAATPGVALLAVRPDPQGASVVISGEALSYGAALDYVAALRRAPALAEAYLAQHERGAGPERLPLAFTVRAPWGHGR